MLTDDGRKVAEAARAKTREWNEKALGALDADQRKDLEDALKAVLERL